MTDIFEKKIINVRKEKSKYFVLSDKDKERYAEEVETYEQESIFNYNIER